MCNGWAAQCQHWQKVFELVEYLGFEAIKVHKIKAHRRVQCASDPEDAFMIKGNCHADALAKLGARKHAFEEERYNEVKEVLALAKGTARFITTMALSFAQDNQAQRREKLLPPPERDSGRGLLSWKPGARIQYVP